LFTLVPLPVDCELNRNFSYERSWRQLTVRMKRQRRQVKLCFEGLLDSLMRRLELLQDCTKVAFEILEAKVDKLGGGSETQHCIIN
jgi:hypothetical protein